MADQRPDWAALRAVFSRLPSASAEASSAAGEDRLAEVQDPEALARDLAEERAAIMEYEGGLSRKRAEALAYEAQGLKGP